MPTTDLLKTFGLSRNPFTDRTAEKTDIDPLSLYIHSDLRGFKPNETTYVFFGRRGSGKTTIRLQMEAAYKQYNDQAIASGRNKGHFMVDLARPGHMTACLATYQEVIGASIDNWDAMFSESWRTADLADCILSYAATELIKRFTKPGEESKQMLETLKSDAKATRQFLLLTHLYSRTDSSSLAQVRAALVKPLFTAAQITVGVGIGITTAASAVAVSQNEDVSSALATPFVALGNRLASAVPIVGAYPKLSAAVTSSAVAGTALLVVRHQAKRALERAASIQRNIRVVKQQEPELLRGLLGRLFNTKDTADTIRLLCIGISAHQKMDLLASLVKLLGYESLCVFGDCFDEVTLLDPVRFPGAMKAFAKEVCRNDILNFGRLHFFFPDSRLSLDLSTDRTLKEARFDRHFVRDLTWSRHQLEELAERRFRAAQEALKDEAAAQGVSTANNAFLADGTTFADLFKKVRGEDFSSYISKLSTPRELLIMMTEMFSRIEAHPEGGLTAQDMEIAVTKALEQSV